jgi:putative methyltransferase (TIGR04325 family)
MRIPPIARRLFRAVVPPRPTIVGDYSSWAEAQSKSIGYDAPSVLRKVLEATLTVRRGEAAFERDSVTFKHPVANPDLLACFNYIAVVTKNRLRVLDFGGALGSTYWQSRPFLPSGLAPEWSVVEQTNYVAAGREFLSDTPLRFFHSIAEAGACRDHDVFLCSGALQYLPDPHTILQHAAALKCEFLVLSRLPLQDLGRDRICVQDASPAGQQATYPVRLFDRASLLSRLADLGFQMIWAVDGPNEENRCVPGPSALWFLRKETSRR